MNRSEEIKAVRRVLRRHATWFFLFLLPPTAFAVAESPAAPFVNPYLAASAYPTTHSASDFTPLAGPVGPGRRLRADEIQWKEVGPVNGFVPLYSGPYPNGKRVIWVGGYDRVAKLDADTLEVLTTYGIGGNTYFTREEIERDVAAMDRLDDKGMLDYSMKLFREPWRNGLTFYRVLSRDNEFYLSYQAADNTISLRAYGEVDPTDPASKILLRREWKIPPELSKAPVMGLNLTSDGWIVMATMDGVMIVLSRDFSTYHSLKLPSRNGDWSSPDMMSSFVRNSQTTDDHGGIYVVTRDYMDRVQWTGSKLSLDEADGGWSAPYPNEIGRGSGTTPALMGWGPQEDHLVVIADATRGNNMMAFWRDAIPDDWKGLPGFDRRVAGITPVHFGVSKNEEVQIENALVVYGYGAFFNNTYPEHHLPDQGGPLKQWMAESFSFHIPGHEAKGGAMIRWDPKDRVLKQAWQTQTNFASSVCTVSSATKLLYCWGARNREWTLEGTDWNTGKSAFTYTLGKSHRFNPLGGPIIVAPNGAVDCGCTGGLGMVRVNPRQSRATIK